MRTEHRIHINSWLNAPFEERTISARVSSTFSFPTQVSNIVFWISNGYMMLANVLFEMGSRMGPPKTFWKVNSGRVRLLKRRGEEVHLLPPHPVSPGSPSFQVGLCTRRSFPVCVGGWGVFLVLTQISLFTPPWIIFKQRQWVNTRQSACKWSQSYTQLLYAQKRSLYWK